MTFCSKFKDDSNLRNTPNSYFDVQKCTYWGVLEISRRNTLRVFQEFKKKVLKKHTRNLLVLAVLFSSWRRSFLLSAYSAREYVASSCTREFRICHRWFSPSFLRTLKKNIGSLDIEHIQNFFVVRLQKGPQIWFKIFSHAFGFLFYEFFRNKVYQKQSCSVLPLKNPLSKCWVELIEICHVASWFLKCLNVHTLKCIKLQSENTKQNFSETSESKKVSGTSSPKMQRTWNSHEIELSVKFAFSN